MRRVILGSVMALGLGISAAFLPAQEEVETASIDKIVLKDASVVIGQIQKMVDGSLTVTTVFGGELKIQWSEVESVQSTGKHEFVLTNDSAIVGTVTPNEDGKLVLSTEGEGIEGSSTVGVQQITAINPPEISAETYKGSINLGINITGGNTQTKNGSLSTDFEAKTERQRLTAGAAYNYAEHSGILTARNTKGRIKYDFFVSKRFFMFGGVFLEQDHFQDLNLRTAVSGGPGYQLIKAGDFESRLFRELEAYGEAGLSFFDEDFRKAVDSRSLAARWSFVVDWPLSSNVTAFHRQEGYPSLERLHDLYVTTEQGVRFQLWENLIATIQMNWRWDNTPSPGFERADTHYLATLGWAFAL